MENMFVKFIQWKSKFFVFKERNFGCLAFHMENWGVLQLRAVHISSDVFNENKKNFFFGHFVFIYQNKGWRAHEHPAGWSSERNLCHNNTLSYPMFRNPNSDYTASIDQKYEEKTNYFLRVLVCPSNVEQIVQTLASSLGITNVN